MARQYRVRPAEQTAIDPSQYVGEVELFNADGTPWAPSGGGGEALTSYATQVETLGDYPASFPSTVAEVTGLQAALDGKQPAGEYATDIELADGLAGKQAAGDYATNTDLNTGLAGKLTDASGQTSRWRGIYANEAALPAGQLGDFAITLG